MAASKTTQWFKDNVSENEDELLEIGALACKALENKLSISLATPMTPIAIYASIFDTITSVIADKESEWESFIVNIADRFKIGFTTTNNEDDEKVIGSHFDLCGNGDVCLRMRCFPGKGSDYGYLYERRYTVGTD